MSESRIAPGLGFRPGAVTALPLAVVVGLFGVSFGVISVSSGGIGAVAAVVMSASAFAGSAQFAAAAIVGAAGQPVAAIAAALLLNARYIPIGVSVARFLPGGPLRRFLIAQLVIDESWAIAARGDGEFDGNRLIGAGAILWLAWVGGTVVGVIGGDALGDPAALGLDAAFPALFLALAGSPAAIEHRRRGGIAGRRHRAGADTIHAARGADHRGVNRGAPRSRPTMSSSWLIVLAIGAGTMIIKASGPVLLGGRALPPQIGAVVALLAPALLAALVVSASVGSGAQLVADARLIGVGAAVIAIALRAPILIVVLVAAVAAAVARLWGIA